MKLINGRNLAEQIKDGIAQEINLHPESRPNLAIILVGDRHDSQLYVKLKEQAAKTVGIDTHLYRLAADTQQAELLSVIDFLNQDPTIDGILLQLPLPDHLNTTAAVQAIDSSKDIEGFTQANSDNLTNLAQPDRIMSPVFLAIMLCLENVDKDWRQRSAIILAKDGIFSQQLKSLLQAEGVRAETIGWPIDADRVNRAGILISALGIAGCITSDYIAPQAIVIDVGISQDKQGKTVGDVAVNAAAAADFLTPVPGGIGPLTIAFALKNTLKVFNRRRSL